MKANPIKPLLLLCIGLAAGSAGAQSLSQLYERVNPAVVVIRTWTPATAGAAGTATARPDATAGLGSGVLISADGEILTASHVVNTAEAIAVEFEGEEPIPADVVTTASEADVALIKLRQLPRKKIQEARLANSDLVKVGDQVMVIGAPFGISHSLSSGYISGRHTRKNVSGGFSLMEFLQTDAAINQGNSGGPMFNLNGEVIGIVSSILTESGGFEGIGFAASSNMARHLLIEERAFWLGIEGHLLTDAMAEIFHLPQPGGVLVQQVVSTSPAGRMGLQGGYLKAQIEDQALLLGGDVILAFDGVRLSDESSLLQVRKRMAMLRKDAPYTMTIFRKGQVLELQSTVP